MDDLVESQFQIAVLTPYESVLFLHVGSINRLIVINMDRKLTKKEKRNITLKVWYKAGGIILGIAIAVGVLLAFVGEKTDEKEPLH